MFSAGIEMEHRPSTLLKRNSSTAVFLWILESIFFHRTSLDDCFSKSLLRLILHHFYSNVIASTLYKSHQKYGDAKKPSPDFDQYQWIRSRNNSTFWQGCAPWMLRVSKTSELVKGLDITVYELSVKSYLYCTKNEVFH